MAISCRGEGAIGFPVSTTPSFDAWWRTLDAGTKEAVAGRVALISAFGPSLGRPYVDTLKGTELHNLKELRLSHRGRESRVLFAFAPERTALLLVGGDKSGQRRWYDQAIRQAEAALRDHIESRHRT